MPDPAQVDRRRDDDEQGTHSDEGGGPLRPGPQATTQRERRARPPLGDRLGQAAREEQAEDRHDDEGHGQAGPAGSRRGEQADQCGDETEECVPADPGALDPRVGLVGQTAAGAPAGEQHEQERAEQRGEGEDALADVQAAAAEDEPQQAARAEHVTEARGGPRHGQTGEDDEQDGDAPSGGRGRRADPRSPHLGPLAGSVVPGRGRPDHLHHRHTPIVTDDAGPVVEASRGPAKDFGIGGNRVPP